MGEDKKKDGLPVEEFWVPANIGEPEPIKTVEIPRDKFITESIIRHSMMFAIQRLEKAAGDKAIDAVSPEDIRAFRELVVAETKPRGGRKTTAAGTLQKQLSHIKSFFQWAKAEKGFIQSNPADESTVPPSIRKDGAAITRKWSHEIP